MKKIMLTGVTVVVPFLNRATFLKRILDSIEKQTYRVDEILIIDNGSGFEEVVKAWEVITMHTLVNRCKFLSTFGRFNANCARNLGIALCETDIIAFLDSDDWWTEKHIERSVNVITDSNKIGSYSGRYELAKFGVRYNKSNDIGKYSSPIDFFFGKNSGAAQSSSFVLRTEELRKHRIYWDENLKRSQDIDFFLSVQTHTSGWVFQNNPEYYIDWSEGGTRGRIDSESIFYFYRKWSPHFSVLARERFFRRYLTSFLSRGMFENFWDLQKLYRTGSRGSIFGYVKSNFLVCMVMALIIKVKLLF